MGVRDTNIDKEGKKIISYIYPVSSFNNYDIKVGDQIIAIDGNRFSSEDEYEDALYLIIPESNTKFTIVRNGQEFTVTAKVKARKYENILDHFKTDAGKNSFTLKN